MAEGMKIASIDKIRIAVRKMLVEEWQKDNSTEVIITYDCKESSFRNKLRDELLKGKYGAVALSESTYKLNDKLEPRQVDKLADEIIDLFENEVLNESKEAIPNSLVRIIIPNGKDFHEIPIELKNDLTIL